ncbi:MAG: protein kinase, partial [Gemmatimonas sp.]
MSDPVLDRLRLATLGSYDIAGELGRGGMAIVYVARDLKLARTVAIKVMDPRLALAQGMADRFLQEARIAAQLQHPNIIVVHEIQHNGELIFFVMGLVEGGSLDELCRPGEPLPIEQARWILLQGARSLAFAHSEGITHRDVKPANILVNVKGDVILTDFGIAKAVGGDSMTKSGTQIGTPTYMSPEQFGNVAAGPASDQYALGVTAYRLLTGETPFSGDLYQLIGAHLNSQPVPLRDVRPDCPAFLANAVMRMLEKKPEHRWPSLDDVIAVFGANMAVDGGVARKQLAMAARALHRQRATSVSALTARAPLSPTPTNAAPVRPLAALADSLVVSISPPGATIFVRGTLQLKATVMQESGEPLTQGKTVWSSADPSVATVSEDGVLEGLTPGVSMVRATAHGAWEEAMIRVEPAPIARVTVTNPKITIRAGDTISPVVRALDVNGVTREDVSFAWTSRAPAIVDVESPGRIRALAPGEAVVEVSVGQMRR